MQTRNGHKPVTLSKKDVLGETAFIFSVGRESVAFGSMEDLLIRVARHLNPVTETRPNKTKKPGMKLGRWVEDNVTLPCTTAEAFQKATKAGYKTTHGTVYSVFWNLRKKGKVMLNSEEKWVEKA